jgi:hypothetical protein
MKRVVNSHFHPARSETIVEVHYFVKDPDLIRSMIALASTSEKQIISILTVLSSLNNKVPECDDTAPFSLARWRICRCKYEKHLATHFRSGKLHQI